MKSFFLSSVKKISSYVCGNEYEKKFLRWAIYGVMAMIVVGIFASLAWWFLFNQVISLDGQTLIGIFSFFVSLPIAIIGAVVAIMIARLAYDIQNQQSSLELKIETINFITPVKHNFTAMSLSLNELFGSVEKHISISEIVLNEYVDALVNEAKYGTQNTVKILLSDAIKNDVIEAEKRVYKAMEGVVSSLEKIYLDPKSSYFFDWQCTREVKNSFMNGLIIKHLSTDKHGLNHTPDIECDPRIREYARIKNSIVSVFYILKSLASNAPDRQSMTNEVMLSYMRRVHESWMIHKVDHVVDFQLPETRARRKLDVLVEILNGRYEYRVYCGNVNQRTSLNLLSEILLGLIQVMPTSDDVTAFINSEFDKNKSYTKLNMLLYSFDSKALLSEELLYLAGLSANNTYLQDNLVKVDTEPLECFEDFVQGGITEESQESLSLSSKEVDS